MDIKTEEGLMEMNEERIKKSLACKSNIDQLIVESYKLLGLMDYLPPAKSETRAWTIKQNSAALEAGAAIHSDFKEKMPSAPK